MRVHNETTIKRGFIADENSIPKTRRRCKKLKGTAWQ